MAEEYKMGASGLLESYLEFNSLRPKKGNWTESRLAQDPYGLKLYRRLVVLFKAFGVRCKPASFHKGEWLDAGSLAYAPLVQRIHEAVAESLPSDLQQPDYHRNSLCFMFKELLSYRINLYPVLNSTSGVLGGLRGLSLHTRQTRRDEPRDLHASRPH